MFYKGSAVSSNGGGSITVDQTYDPISTNAQSGTAVAEAVATKQNVIDANNKLSASYVSGLATVATTGDYSDLSNTPTIPTVIPADNLTITENASNQLQTVGIINQNTNVGAINPLKVWNGTEQEWNTGASQTWYNWEYTTPITWSSKYNALNPSDADTIYVNGQYISVGNSNYYVDISSDGTNWSNAATIVSIETQYSGEARGIAYGNGKYIIVGGVILSSTDLTNWTFVYLPSNELRSVIYVNNKFIAVGNSGIILSSADGNNWTAETSGVSTNLYSIAYGNGKYIVVGDNGTILSSIDGSTWTAETIDSSVGKIDKVIYANEQFILTFGDTNYIYVGVAYSSDGSTWTIDTSIPQFIYGLGLSLAYGNGILYVGSAEQGSLYFDGSNWSTIEWDKYINSIIFTNDKFLVRSSSSASIVTGGISSVFTDTTEPTTASTVYSEPSVTSALTITAVGTGTITLSDTNTYDYNASGNQTTTSSIGQAHPDWLCFINGVGVKIGTTTIAQVNAS